MRNPSKITVVNGVRVLVVSVFAVLEAGCATLEQNMDKSKQEYVIPGKELHVAGMNNYPFCEIGLITGTSKSNAVLNIWNTTGVSDCPPDKLAAIEADQGERIKKATGVRKVWINPRRHWTFDEFWVRVVGSNRDFEGVNAAWMGVVGAEVAAAAVGGGHYHPGQIFRQSAFKFNKGSTVYLLDTPDGKVLVMQSWTDHFNKDETAENIKDLGSQFKELPPGWKFRVKVLGQDLMVEPKAPTYWAWVTQDEFQNTYEGCGYDAACNFVP